MIYKSNVMSDIYFAANGVEDKENSLQKEKVDQVSEYDVKITYGFSKDGNYIIGRI